MANRTEKTYNGPNGLTLVLDSAEVYPEDPGQGTPAMLHMGEHSGTYWHVDALGHFDEGPTLNREQLEWIVSMADAVDKVTGFRNW